MKNTPKIKPYLLSLAPVLLVIVPVILYIGQRDNFFVRWFFSSWKIPIYILLVLLFAGYIDKFHNQRAYFDDMESNKILSGGSSLLRIVFLLILICILITFLVYILIVIDANLF